MIEGQEGIRRVKEREQGEQQGRARCKLQGEQGVNGLVNGHGPLIHGLGADGGRRRRRLGEALVGGFISVTAKY